MAKLKKSPVSKAKVKYKQKRHSERYAKAGPGAKMEHHFAESRKKQSKADKPSRGTGGAPHRPRSSGGLNAPRYSYQKGKPPLRRGNPHGYEHRE